MCVRTRTHTHTHTQFSIPSICVCVFISHVWLFATLWTVACQAPLSVRFSQARRPEWIAISSCRGTFQPRDQTHVSHVSHISYISQQILYLWATWEATQPSLFCPAHSKPNAKMLRLAAEKRLIQGSQVKSWDVGSQIPLPEWLGWGVGMLMGKE